VVTPSAKKDALVGIQNEFGLSQRRVSTFLAISREALRYKPRLKNDAIILADIQKIIAEQPRFGCPRVYLSLRRSGMVINHKKVARIYYGNDLKLSKRPAKRKRRRPISSLPTATGKLQRWSMDFVHDNLSDGRAIRILTVIDEHTRQCVKMVFDTNINSGRLVEELGRIKKQGGLPSEFGLDSGPEFTSQALSDFAKENGIALGYCSPGNKNENAFIESFNGRLRDECLNMNWFSTLDEARYQIEKWRIRYNEKRLHTSLGGLTPNEFANGERCVLVA
jgi:putative transposase